MIYDNHVKCDNIESITKVAKLLGWSGFVLVKKWKTGMKFENKKKSGLNIISGAEIGGRPDEVRKMAQKLRKSVDIIVVKGGDLEVNRQAVETPYVDVLIQPWGDPINKLRNDPGFNHIMAKLAKKNSVFIDFNITDLIKSHKKTRVKLYSHMMKVAKLVKKYNTPFILSSGAISEWDMRSPSDLKSFGKILGFEDSHIKKAISDVIIKENQKRKKSGWIQPGVEVVKS